jgi:perosamine synthetase
MAGPTREPLTTGWLTQGPKVSEFEKAFAERHGVSHALATTSCTTGLHLILAAMGVGPGDEVVVPAFTWVATANVVVYCGATPVFADVDWRTNNIDPADVARRITPNTKAVIAVHLFGLCADMDALREVCAAAYPDRRGCCLCSGRHLQGARGRFARARCCLLVPPPASRLRPGKVAW